MSRTKATKIRNTVALAVDDRMVYGFLVLAQTIARLGSPQPRLVVGFFTGELSAQNQDLLSEYLSWLKIEHQWVESEPHSLFTERRHLTITTFSKFVLADALQRPHLWLDIDTIVRPGWDDIFQTINHPPSAGGLVVAEKIVSPHTRFDGFNAGVLGWTGKPRKQWVERLAALPEKRFSSEQYLFNTLYGDDVITVPSSYNFLSSWHQELARSAEPRILHYSGPLKPWHLPRRHVRAWQSINPTWNFWFEAEDEFLRELSSSPLHPKIVREQRRALFSARLHTGKGAFAGWILRSLAVAGPLGIPLVWLIRWRATQ